MFMLLVNQDAPIFSEIHPSWLNYFAGFIFVIARVTDFFDCYIARTFIMPGQETREKSVRQKLNPLGIEFKGKNVLLVDDSIVRGTTSKQIIQMAKDVGAKKVYMASASPAVRYPNIYGIDMPVASELVAHNRTEEEVAEFIEADRLFYLPLEDLIDAIQTGNPELKEFDCSVFDGNYIIGGSEEYFKQLEIFRSDKSKDTHNTGTVIDIV